MAGSWPLFFFSPNIKYISVKSKRYGLYSLSGSRMNTRQASNASIGFGQ